MKVKTKKKSIELTEKQFKALLKAVYLGNWVANAYRAENHKKDYENIEDYIFSFAPQFDFAEYVAHEESDGDKFYPTSFFEDTTDVHEIHEEYDEETFWDELSDRLGTRDFIEKFSRAEIERMSDEEHFSKISECIDFYNEEFEKFGIERIRIKMNSIKKVVN